MNDTPDSHEREPTIFTIGHSTRPIDTFVALLHTHRVETLVDVRTVPRSGRHPQFNRETLLATLAATGIGYVHMSALGGLRRPRPDSINSGWRNEGFRGYADHMQTPEFDEHLRRLIDRARHERVAIMCAEAVPWRCHRSLIADALTVRGIGVEHVLGSAPAQAHRLTPFARVQGTTVTYPSVEPLDLPFDAS
jgi:uncharacterized protein (DUF488 family)